MVEKQIGDGEQDSEAIKACLWKALGGDLRSLTKWIYMLMKIELWEGSWAL